MARKNDNKIWIALGISVALLGAIVAVNYLYGWNNVLEDVQSMGKSVWFAFSDWIGVKNGNETVIMPEPYANDTDIVERGTNVTIIDRFVNISDRFLERFTNTSMSAIQAIRNVNTTALQEQLSSAIGASVEFINVTLDTGREVLIPLENATRRALGTSFNAFIEGVREEFEDFFSEENLQYLLSTIIEIPQSIVQSIQSMLSQLAGVGSGFMSGRENALPDLDAMTGAEVPYNRGAI